MQNLHTQNEKLLAEAREERAMMLKEAKETKDAIINEAKNKAKEEATKIVSGAMQQIDQQKKVAMDETYNPKLTEQDVIEALGPIMYDNACFGFNLDATKLITF